MNVLINIWYDEYFTPNQLGTVELNSKTGWVM